MAGSPSSMEEHEHHSKKKRVGKACDSCRIKKTKCDGKKPCSRCVLDNKICVFTEKKKGKEKTHPSGYVELLETRLDLLTKSLEKLVQLTRPHLSFLDELANDNDNNDNNYNDNDGDDDDDEECSIPINDVVSYLIDNEGLLSNLPVEWEKGAMIAANLTSDASNVKMAAKKFHEHSLKCEQSELGQGDEDYGDEKGGDNRSALAETEDTGETTIEAATETAIEIGTENEDMTKASQIHPLGSPETSPTSNNLTEKMNLDDYSLGGYSSNLILGPNADFSDFDTDSARSHTQPASSNSLFSNEPTPSSITSLTTDLESHGIHSPTSLSSINAPSHPSTRTFRRSSSSGQKPYPSSIQKQKQNGHITKPHHSHSHSHSHTHPQIQRRSSNSLPHQGYINNNGNELDSRRKPSSTSSTNSSSSTPASQQLLFTNLEEISSLPSDAFKQLNGDYHELSIMDTENVDTLLTNNPCLN